MPINYPPLDVTTFNDDGFIYVKGDDDTDGSIRLVPDVLKENVEFQIRENGVWNDTGIQIAASSIHLARDLQIAGGGQFISTFDTIDDATSLIPHIIFDDEGTAIDPHMPILGPKIIRFVVQSDDSSEVVGTELTAVFTSPIKALRSKFYLKTGSVGATSPVSFSLHRGSVSTGNLIFQINIPTSVMATPNTEFQIELEGLLQQDIGDTVHATVTSDNTISMASDSLGIFFLALDFYRLTTEDILTDTFTLANDLSLTLSNTLSFTRPNPVF